MALARRFEDLQVWQEASALTVEVYRVARQPRALADRAFCDQMCRAAVSIMNNIAEGFERDGRREFAQFLRIAKGSAGEVRSLLHLALSLGYLTAMQHTALTASAETLSRRISRFIASLQKPRRTAPPAGRGADPVT
ncbi:MAG TPA: four helix bundle protein [Verrucomicrobiota bacterium]|nr:four helix bundle protein [Verrucomicrobiota bacterium]